MSVTFDPYYIWLAIPPEEQPPHLYRLLALKPLEDNLDVIENAADQRMRHLRAYQSGKHAESSQKLLNEIATAKVTLLDPAKKSAYDTELRTKLNAVKQAELRKVREERPLAQAKPLESESATVAQPVTVASPQFVAPARSAARRKSDSLGLIVAGVAVLLVLGIGGAAAMMLLSEGPHVADNSPLVTPPNSATKQDRTTPTKVAPVVPPVIPPPISKPPQDIAPPTDVAPPADVPPRQDVAPLDVGPAEESTVPAEKPPVNDAPFAEPLGGEAATDQPAAPTKLPVPEKTEREAKRNEILQLFPTADARTFEQKSSVAANLIRIAGESAEDPAAQFALLNLAREQAVEAGNISLAFDAIGALAKTFEFDSDAVRVASLQQASRATLPPAGKRDIIVAGMSIIDELSAADKFTEADALSDRMLAVARPLRDAELIKGVADQRKKITELSVGYKKAQTAFETLKTSPDDAEAHLVAGRYLAFIKQDWDAGLAHLAKGSDAALAAAAKAELAAPDEPDKQLALGDAWWDAGEKQKEPVAKTMCQLKASAAYEEVAGGLTGLTKARVEKRLADASSVNATLLNNDRAKLRYVYLDDLKESDAKVGHGVVGKHGVHADGKSKLLFQGQVPQHALSIHGTGGGASYATYNLDESYSTFDAIAGIADRQPDLSPDIRPASPLWFEVHGDGKLLWKSEKMQAFGVGVKSNVPIAGVKQLKLSVHCPGSNERAWSVWIDPRIGREQGRRTSPMSSPEPVFLDDLTETSVRVGAGALGKHGQGGGNTEFEGRKVAHSLTTHAVTDGVAHVAYDIGGKYETFEGAVGLWVQPGRSGKSGAPIVFRIIGDEKPLWASQPHQTLGISEPFRIRVRGVKTLRLEAHCAGNHVEGWAVWLEPRVTAKK
jgi:hypothetical protein